MKKLYEDRGMIKWQGLMLAEHGEQIKLENEKREKETHPLYLDEQALEEMQRIVVESYHEQREVELQVNTFRLPYIEGFGVAKSLISPESGRLLLTDGSYCIKDILSIQLADGNDYN
ncbi:YolD-like family protein [Domibacillus sp. A3M-37]|uniref:YolD-like family protein n=1 Tax=Domibacillus sp. A3M-37 TaxID=2962037 RepID=UPI0020B8D33D|nr:YolD-like family protein [Domibacillus sp. A3M-37]MCP3764662.1 YolD-like family protein [Domibacillus sp. A3M-37]